MEKVKEMYTVIFKDDWPFWAGGVFLAILAILMWTWGQPWAVIGGYRNWADWFLTGIGVYEGKKLVSPLLDPKSIMALGIVFGAFTAALISGSFGFRMPPWFELLKGAIAGTLMGFSAVIAGGCNIGGFYSQLAAFSLSGLVMWAGLIIGVILGLKYLMWEMEHVPASVLSKGVSFPPPPAAWKAVQPYLGWFLLFLIVVMPILYGSHTKYGILASIALLSGFVMHRSRFCFAATFRDPFMTGDSEKTQSVILSILIVMVGVAMIKWLDATYIAKVSEMTGIREKIIEYRWGIFMRESRYVFSNAGWGGIVGGIIFGFGMILAGGCGSGTLWRVGEGQIKLWAAMVTMAISNSLTKAWLWPKLRAGELSFGKAVFLPKYVGWEGAFIIILGVMIIWYFFVLWNEETDTCVVM
ncbi:MAG: YeeE/YedE family protein [Desulfobacterales bacterium]|nr:YeeE/YedE family protein [Desulfobacterales bacterium]